MTINCSLGGSDSLHGGDGDVDYIIGGSLNDTIYGDDNNSTNIGNSDVVFGDHAEILFNGHESHILEQVATIDGNCSSGGNDIISMGPGDDLVSFAVLRPCVGVIKSMFGHLTVVSSYARHLEATCMILSKEMTGRILLLEISPSTIPGPRSVTRRFFVPFTVILAVPTPCMEEKENWTT